VQYFMVPLLVLISIFAIRGTYFNKKTGNKPGFIIGGIFTLGILGVTGLALWDLFVGLQ
jgi:cobalamin biosynthesis protein CbiD